MRDELPVRVVNAEFDNVLKEINTIKTMMVGLEEDHAEVFGDWRKLSDRYNSKIAMAKVLAKQEKWNSSCSLTNGFSVQVRDYSNFDPMLLLEKCPKILLEEGVVIRVDKKRIFELLEHKKYNEDDVESAWVDKEQTAVYTPSSIEAEW